MDERFDWNGKKFKVVILHSYGTGMSNPKIYRTTMG